MSLIQERRMRLREPSGLMAETSGPPDGREAACKRGDLAYTDVVCTPDGAVFNQLLSSLRALVSDSSA